MLTIVSALTFPSMINATTEILNAKNFFISLYFSFNEHSVDLSMKKFITSGPVMVESVMALALFTF